MVVLSGRSLGVVAPAFAQRPQPCTVTLEDVDLVAEERRHLGLPNTRAVEAARRLDGPREDSDALVLLTTDRPDLREPAPAARPGRIDVALEVPPRDAAPEEFLGIGLQHAARPPGGTTAWAPPPPDPGGPG